MNESRIVKVYVVKNRNSAEIPATFGKVNTLHANHYM